MSCCLSVKAACHGQGKSTCSGYITPNPGRKTPLIIYMETPSYGTRYLGAGFAFAAIPSSTAAAAAAAADSTRHGQPAASSPQSAVGGWHQQQIWRFFC